MKSEGRRPRSECFPQLATLKQVSRSVLGWSLARISVLCVPFYTELQVMRKSGSLLRSSLPLSGGRLTTDTPPLLSPSTPSVYLRPHKHLLALGLPSLRLPLAGGEEGRLPLSRERRHA